MSDIKTKWLIALFVVILVGIIFWAFPSIPKIDLMKNYQNKEATSTSEETATTTPETGWNVYKNTEYGFEVRYPQEILPETTFRKLYHLSDGWRAGGLLNSTGTPIVAFPLYRTENESSYPRYYNAEVRVGISISPEDVANCTSSSPYTNASSTEVVINGTVFYEFPVQDAGMMQYLEGKSFRTVRNGICFAVEQLRAGSSYRDTTSSMESIDMMLREYYDKGSDIVKTFKFLN